MSPGRITRFVPLLVVWSAALGAQEPAAGDRELLASLDAEVFDSRAFLAIVEGGARHVEALAAIATGAAPSAELAARRRTRALRALREIDDASAAPAFQALVDHAQSESIDDDALADLMLTIAAFAPALGTGPEVAQSIQQLTMFGMEGKAGGGRPRHNHLRCLLSGIRIHVRCRTGEAAAHGSTGTKAWGTKALIEQLLDQDPFLREFAAERLGRLADRSPAVLDALRAAATATDHPRQAKIVGPGFSSSVGTDFGEMIRGAASIALARLAPDDPLARDGLAKLLRADDPRERVAAAMALGPSAEEGAPDVVPALLEASADDDPLVAAEAVTALGRIGDGRASVLERLRALAAGEGALAARSKAALRRLERETGKG